MILDVTPELVVRDYQDQHKNLADFNLYRFGTSIRAKKQALWAPTGTGVSLGIISFAAILNTSHTDQVRFDYNYTVGPPAVYQDSVIIEPRLWIAFPNLPIRLCRVASLGASDIKIETYLILHAESDEDPQ